MSNLVLSTEIAENHMQHSIKDTSTALARTLSGGISGNSIFEAALAKNTRRIKNYVDKKTVKGEKKPGSGQTSARYLSDEEAAIASIFCVLADYGFDEPTLSVLRWSLTPKPQGVVESMSADGTRESKFYWGEPSNTTPPTGYVESLISDDQPWVFGVILLRDASGDATRRGLLAPEGVFDDQLREAGAQWSDFHNDQGVREIGYVTLYASEVIMPVLAILKSGL
jgi:hypothetical protein